MDFGTLMETFESVAIELRPGAEAFM